MGEETVRLSISIEISQHDDDYDTGIPVSTWNALTDAERGSKYQEIWEAMASRDNGGVTVLTPGAEGL